MQELIAFLTTKVSYEENPTCIFAERFPQFKAMYNFIAPSINYIQSITVINAYTYILHVILPHDYFYKTINNSTVEIDDRIYRASIDYTSNSLILTINEES